MLDFIRVIKSRSMKWVGHMPHMRGKVLIGEPEGQRSLGRGRNSWERNITVDLDKIGLHLSG
jgi:hypothetical protein